MESILYVYSDQLLDDLKMAMSDYDFFSIAYFFHLCNTLPALNELNLNDFERIVIDITNLIKDGNYYKVFTERYLYTLSEKIAEVNFCINCNVFENFIKQFPHVFDKAGINYDFNYKLNEDRLEEQSTPSVKHRENIYLTLYTYKELSFVKERYKAGTLISLSDLIDKYEGMSFQYNLENISQILELRDVEYVDLSSVVKMLKLRQDLILPFEILMHRIMSIRKVKYCVEYARISDVNGIFPLYFSEEILIDNSESLSEIADEKSAIIDIGSVTALALEVCDKLRGHDIFKADFQRNLLKFSFLNKLGERKILSIILCGDSGLGKTQFAKFMSQVMFPEEPFIKINFGNYSTEGVLNSLIGSPLGYAGSEEGGELINKIDTSKAKVILIDEFEKATPSVYNFFYELLEDGIFTDRHGIAHNLDGYIIVFTANMTKNAFHEKIPDSLKSRFDMVYYFVGLSIEEKRQYIRTTAIDFSENLKIHFNTKIEIENIQGKLNELVECDNLRDIKRKVEDIVFNRFLECYKQE